MNESLLATSDPVEQNIQSYKDLLVGEGKKFKDDEALARGKYESDNMIEVLKKQQDELRADYLKLREEATSRAKLEELIGQLETRQQNNSTLPPENNVQKPVIDPKEIESLVSNKLQEFENSKKERENFNSVSNKLKEVYGNDYPNVLKEKIAALGLTEDFVNDLARKHPTVLLKTIGVDEQVQQQNFQAPPRSNARSDQFAPKGQEKRTWSYYQKMKAENPKLYYDPQTNVNIHNDMLALGDAFKDGDYHKYGD